jgi:hypothetical protein
MGTTAVCGKNGRVTLGAVIAEVTGWKLDEEYDLLDATHMDGGGEHEDILGIHKWSGSFTSQVYSAEIGAVSAATFEVDRNSTAANKPKWSGAIKVGRRSVAPDVNGKVQYEYTFNGQLAVTIATA